MGEDDEGVLALGQCGSGRVMMQDGRYGGTHPCFLSDERMIVIGAQRVLVYDVCLLVSLSY